MSENYADVDIRVKRSRLLIENAFLELLGEKSLSKVTVGDIATRAGVNRSTFYTHFYDKYALFDHIVLSRLGLRVQLDGNWIGDTPEGERLVATIQGYGIDARRLWVKKGFSGVREVVVSDERSRTIFGNYIDLLFSTRKWNIPKKVDLASARIVCVDPPFGDESALVGKYAVELGIPFVSVDAAYNNTLATKDFMPYRVNVVDSAGAGDSFRAGVVHGMLKQWRDARIIQYASTVAAMVCQRFPGVLNSPTHAEVVQFIQAHQVGTAQS